MGKSERLYMIHEGHEETDPAYVMGEFPNTGDIEGFKDVYGSAIVVTRMEASKNPRHVEALAAWEAGNDDAAKVAEDKFIREAEQEAREDGIA